MTMPTPTPPPPATPAPARRRPDRLTLLLAAIAILGAALVLARQTAYGPALHHDSIQYISVARNLLAGEGFSHFDGTVYTWWPPVYPLLLAAATFGIFDPLDAAGPLNAIIFGITIFVVGQYLRRRLLSRYLAVWASVMIALSIPLALWSSWVLSGATFILMATLALTLTDKFVAEGKTSYLIWAAVFCALAWQTRYIGVVVLLVAGLSILAQRRAPLLQRARQTAVFSLIVSAPMSLWLLRNYLLTGNFTGPQRPNGDPLPKIIGDIGNEFMGWVNYDIPFGILPLLTLTLIAVAMLMPAIPIPLGKHYEKLPQFDWRPFCLFSGFALTYFLFLVTATVLGYTFIGIQLRYVTPFYIPLLSALVFALDWLLTQDRNGKLLGSIENLPILKHSYRKINAPGLLTCILTASLFLWAAWQIFPNTKEIIRVNSGNLHSVDNFNAPPWADSETLEYARKNLLSGEIYSNAEHIVYLRHTGNANFRPAPRETQGIARGIAAGQAQLNAWIAEIPNGAHLVWFTKYWQNQFYDYGTANINITPKLEPVAKLKDGIIVKVNQNYAPPANIYRSTYAAITSGDFGKPATQSDFDLYHSDNTLAYLKQPCAPDDAEARFFLHIYPVNINDLPPHRRQYRFANLDFTFPEYGIFLDDNCLAIVSLPDYEIASIRTGQQQTWQTEFSLRANSYRSKYDAIISGGFGKPAAQSDFDLYHSDNTLAYLKQPCAPDDTAARFFLHIYPANANDLPAPRRQYRFDNLDFSFPEYGIMLDDKCLAIIPLPDYQIARIHTGQWTPGQRQIWKAEFPPAVPAMTPPP